MIINVVREPKESVTFGKLFVDGEYFCETLEDIDRQLEETGTACKINGDTCIPRGKYQVVIDYSNRFKCQMMRVKNVPFFEGIRIHAGNTTEDTHGCLLVGSGRTEHGIINSRVTLKKLFELVDSCLSTGEEVTIEYV